MRNTGQVNARQTARSGWLARPESDREAWNNFRRATDVDALLHLSVADDDCLRMATLARAISRSPSALTRLVDRLEDRGLVERTRHSSTDVSVTVTSRGRDLLDEAGPRIVAQVEELFWSRLTAKELDTLSTICAKLMEGDSPRC